MQALFPCSYYQIISLLKPSGTNALVMKLSKSSPVKRIILPNECFQPGNSYLFFFFSSRMKFASFAANIDSLLSSCAANIVFNGRYLESPCDVRSMIDVSNFLFESEEETSTRFTSFFDIS